VTRSERVQIRDDFLQLLLVKLAAERGHHASAADDALHYVVVSRCETAGQIRLLVKLFQPWSLVPAGRICVMAGNAINVEDFASTGLLYIQSQFGIGHFGWIFAATGQQSNHCHHQKNGRYSTQVTIMSLAWHFENPWKQNCH
jgi:hypothetical protein